MNSLQASILELAIKDFDSKLLPHARLIGNGEWVVVLYGQGGYRIWDTEEWEYLRDNWIEPVPYHHQNSHKLSKEKAS
jgi:hypothetical protein